MQLVLSPKSQNVTYISLYGNYKRNFFGSNSERHLEPGAAILRKFANDARFSYKILKRLTN